MHSSSSSSRVGIVGGGGFPQFMSTGAHFWVKIGFKFQSLGKISNISAADLPPILLSQFQHWSSSGSGSSENSSLCQVQDTDPQHLKLQGPEFARFAKKFIHWKGGYM